jgi:hypothetical protein
MEESFVRDCATFHARVGSMGEYTARPEAPTTWWSGARAAEIAKLFSENLEWEIAGDNGVLPWIGRKPGRAAITDFV